MKILFVENRYRTLFWREMAKYLIADGHDIRFIIQNHTFKDKKYVATGRDIVIPYPKIKKGQTIDPKNSEIIKSDRNINYFGHKDSIHYDYYRQKIESIITEFSPDVVFGESTAFHELITIDICKERGVLYLHPSTCRYPTGRFSFYKYDTLIPFGGSQENLESEKALEIISSIANRSVKPDYMKVKIPTLKSKIKRFKELLFHTISYYGGEHYNTPNPIVKRRIERKKNSLIREWDKIALERKEYLNDNSFKILYPMQMQPEANLDVWGRPFRDQMNTIKEIVEATPDTVKIIVKPNPKTKYELTKNMIQYIKNNPRVIPIVRITPMEEVLPLSNLTITVTGTIAIECVLSDKPVVTLVNTIINEAGNCPYLDSFENLPDYIKMICKKKLMFPSECEKKNFVNLLNRTSYPGLPYERHLGIENIQLCTNAFRSILKN